MTADTARIFLGLELSDNARRALNEARRTLEGAGVTGKFHNAPLYHLTLVFLGNLSAQTLPALKEVMDSIPCAPFDLTLSSLGTFKNGSILWAGVKDSPALMAYRRRLAQALREAGFAFDEGEYRPHITLARQVKTAPPSIEIPEVTFPARHATLFESTRIDGALTYLPLYRSVFS